MGVQSSSWSGHRWKNRYGGGYWTVRRWSGNTVRVVARQGGVRDGRKLQLSFLPETFGRRPRRLWVVIRRVRVCSGRGVRGSVGWRGLGARRGVWGPGSSDGHRRALGFNGAARALVARGFKSAISFAGSTGGGGVLVASPWTSRGGSGRSGSSPWNTGEEGGCSGSGGLHGVVA